MKTVCAQSVNRLYTNSIWSSWIINSMILKIKFCGFDQSLAARRVFIMTSPVSGSVGLKENKAMLKAVSSFNLVRQAVKLKKGN